MSEVAMSIDTIERPAVSPGNTAASRPDGAKIDSDPSDLDISFIENGPKANTVALTPRCCEPPSRRAKRITKRGAGRHRPAIGDAPGTCESARKTQARAVGGAR